MADHAVPPNRRPGGPQVLVRKIGRDVIAQCRDQLGADAKQVEVLSYGEGLLLVRAPAGIAFARCLQQIADADAAAQLEAARAATAAGPPTADDSSNSSGGA